MPMQLLLLKNTVWTPSKMIARLGKEINDESSYLYWAYKNGIPVYCPALTDGSLGDMLYCHSIRNPGLLLDIVQDVRAMNEEAVHAGTRKTGMIILGGGLPKHHIYNANMMRNGADFAVIINTAQEFDGSDSGALPDEAVSWGKIRGSAKSIKTLDQPNANFWMKQGTILRRSPSHQFRTQIHDLYELSILSYLRDFGNDNLFIHPNPHTITAKIPRDVHAMHDGRFHAVILSLDYGL